MTKDESTARFNALPIGHRTTVIAYNLQEQIRIMEREKAKESIAYHRRMMDYNSEIRRLEKSLDELKDAEGLR